MKKVLLFALGLSLAATVSFTSCSDDDPSLREQVDYVKDNISDLLAGDINGSYYDDYETVYGTVKTIEQKDYHTARWDSTKNEPVVSSTDISYKYTSEFNKSGFLTKETAYSVYKTSDGNLNLNYAIENTLDHRNRPVFTKQIDYQYNYSTSVSLGSSRIESTIEYDDKNGIATVITSNYDTSGTQTSTTKKVHDLLDNGRLDEDAYTEYVRAAVGDDLTEPSFAKERVKVKDSKKNWTLAYTKYMYLSSKTTYVNYYSTRDIVYY